jgi:hypothetical protein
MNIQNNQMLPGAKRMERILTRYCFALGEFAKNPNQKTLAINQKLLSTISEFYDVMENYVSQIEESLNISTEEEMHNHG